MDWKNILLIFIWGLVDGICFFEIISGIIVIRNINKQTREIEQENKRYEEQMLEEEKNRKEN